MQSMNYNHLYYFWVVAREGSIARASEILMVAPPTISAQIKTLEKSLKQSLFAKSGRSLILTDTGRLVQRHADTMFHTGRDLLETLQGRLSGEPLRMTVGIADALPKVIVYQLLKPARNLVQPVKLICHEGKPAALLAELAAHGLDVVLSDSPIGSEIKVKAFNHLLGECGITVFGVSQLATRLRRSFPRSLHGAPFLLPTRAASLRRSLDAWFDAEGIRPQVEVEVDDSALLKVFGQSGDGLFAAPTVIEAEIRRQYKVSIVGRLPSVRERFYAISIERQLKHPAVVALTEEARQRLFA